MTDGFDLERFVAAQAAPYCAGATISTYEGALAELTAGAKTGHWIWFILPQLEGLGQSYRSEFYGIAGLAEAAAYVAHPVLGPRLHDCVGALLTHRVKSAEAILGGLDAKKFQSCLTLFSRAAPAETIFAQALDRFFGGAQDPRTLRLLGAEPPPVSDG